MSRASQAPAFESVPSPALLVDKDRLEDNIRRMQAVCDAHGTALWPHIKTHKMVEVARMQLEAGAAGLVCAKLGEAEALLESGVRRLFIAYPLVDRLHGPRLRALAGRLEELIVAATSEPQAQALEDLLAAVDLRLPVMLAVDTGLGREGARDPQSAARLAALIDRLPHLQLRGLFTHEGQAYGGGDVTAVVEEAHARLLAVRDRIDPTLPLWPGSTITAARMAALPGVSAVRPGTYVFGDLTQAAAGSMAWENLALTVLTAVVDRPEPALALLDAGSKTLTSDRLPDGRQAALYDRRDIHVSRCSEEHGFATGRQVGQLRVGEKVRAVPAHVCPVVNLADEVVVLSGGEIVDTWRVAARGKVR